MPTKHKYMGKASVKRQKKSSFPRRMPDVLPAEHTVDPHYRRAFIENITGRAPLPEFEAPYGRGWGQYYNPKTDRLSTVKKQLPIQGPPNYTQIWHKKSRVGDDWEPIFGSGVPLLRDHLQYLQTASERLGRIKFIKELGGGCHGEVWLVKTRRGKQKPQYMACKIIPIDNIDDYPSVKDVVESLIQDTLHINHLSAHPNICQIIDSIGIPDRQTGFPYSRYCLFMELCESDLGKLCEFKCMSEQQCIGWLGQIASAVQYLHVNGVVHMDIKPDNILLQNNDQTAKLCDFGCALSFPKGVVMRFNAQTHIGDEDYAAPEVCGNDDFMAKPCDIFSLGMTIAECLIATSMFKRLSKDQVLPIAIGWPLGGPTNDQNVSHRSVPMGHLLQSMLNPDPNLRPTIDDVLADPLLM